MPSSRGPNLGCWWLLEKEVLLYHRRHTEAALAGDHYHPGRCHLDSSHFDSIIVYEFVLIVGAQHHFDSTIVYECVLIVGAQHGLGF